MFAIFLQKIVALCL